MVLHTFSLTPRFPLETSLWLNPWRSGQNAELIHMHEEQQAYNLFSELDSCFGGTKEQDVRRWKEGCKCWIGKESWHMPSKELFNLLFLQTKCLICGVKEEIQLQLSLTKTHNKQGDGTNIKWSRPHILWFTRPPSWNTTCVKSAYIGFQNSNQKVNVAITKWHKHIKCVHFKCVWSDSCSTANDGSLYSHRSRLPHCGCVCLV